jgi:hypothetical protein
MMNDEMKKVAEVLAELAEANGGRLDPRDVVEAARPAKSVLHPHFQWDDDAAAENWRIVQAQGLIRRVRVVYEAASEKAVTVRAFVNVQPAEDDEPPERRGTRGPLPGVYVPMVDAMAREDWREQVLAQCRRDMNAFRRKYAALKEVAVVIEAMDAVERRRK